MGVLIEADELAQLLQSDQPPVLLDVRWELGGPSQQPEYLRGHIPGAQWVDLDAELSNPYADSGGRHPLPAPKAFEAAMRALGVDNDSTVVVYDASNSLAASRLWWLLADAGKDDVRVLNGGYAAWMLADLEVATGPGAEPRSGDFVVRAGQLPQIDGAELAARIAAGNPPPIIDVRGPERYAGESEPIDPVAGHIPGATNVWSMINIGEDGRFLPAAEIAGHYQAGESPVVYCGSGITAAHTALARVVAELPMATVYPGSWSDWITDTERPVATGDQP